MNFIIVRVQKDKKDQEVRRGEALGYGTYAMNM